MDFPNVSSEMYHADVIRARCTLMMTTDATYDVDGADVVDDNSVLCRDDFMPACITAYLTYIYIILTTSWCLDYLSGVSVVRSHNVLRLGR